MTELKPCPFCGSDSIREIGTFERAIICLSCGVQTQAISVRRDPLCQKIAAKQYEEQDAKVCAAWNQRVLRKCRATVQHEVDAVWGDEVSVCNRCHAALDLMYYSPAIGEGYLKYVPVFCPGCGAEIEKEETP